MAAAEQDRQAEAESKPSIMNTLCISESVFKSITKRQVRVLVISAGSGLVLPILLLAVAVLISDPTQFQASIFHSTLLLATVFSTTVPVFLRSELRPWDKGLISASGVVALFTLASLVSPSILVDQPLDPSSEIVEQSLVDMMLDVQGLLLPCVMVMSLESPLSDITEPREILSTKVNAEADTSVQLIAYQPGSQRHRYDVTLVNTRLSFTVEHQA